MWIGQSIQISQLIKFKHVYFCKMDFKSKLLNDAVDQMATLPGIGKRTALRLVLHLLDQQNDEVKKFSNSFKKIPFF